VSAVAAAAAMMVTIGAAALAALEAFRRRDLLGASVDPIVAWVRFRGLARLRDELTDFTSAACRRSPAEGESAVTLKVRLQHSGSRQGERLLFVVGEGEAGRQGRVWPWQLPRLVVTHCWTAAAESLATGSPPGAAGTS